MNFYIILILFVSFIFNCKYILTKSMSEDVPTGSVLFHDKKCWLHEDLVLLSARKTMQNLIPTNMQDMDNDAFIIVLIDYFRMCFSVIQKMSSGRAQDILLLALADAIGGYLHFYVIPITKQAFYAGNVRYDYAKKLFAFYDQIRVHLDTSGKLWSKPIDTSKMRLKVHTLTVRPPPNNEDPCSLLIINDKASAKSCKSGATSIIPIPYLDDCESPSAIAVPFRSSSLRKLSSSGGAFILEKYYVLSSQCLISRSSSNEIIAGFNNNFHQWLVQAVIPHLNDDQWYPAFGGVLKIIENMKQYNTGKNRIVWNDTLRSANNNNDNFKQPTTADCDKETGQQEELEPPEGAQDDIIRWSMLMAVGLGVLTAWICGMVLCVCMRCQKRNNKQQRLDVDKVDEESGYQFVNTFVQVIYDMKDGVNNMMGIKGSTGSESKLNQNKGGDNLRIDSREDDMSVDIAINSQNEMPHYRMENTTEAEPKKESSAKISKARSAPLPELSSDFEVRRFSVQSGFDDMANPYRSRDSTDVSDRSYTNSDLDISSSDGGADLADITATSI